MSWINICDIIYPIGCIYTSADSTPAELFGGTWEQIGNNRVLMNTTTASKLGTTVNSGLPNITGSVHANATYSGSPYSNGSFSGAFYASTMEAQYYLSGRSTGSGWADIGFNAANSNSIYGSSTIVQPPAYYVYIWRRTA